MAACESSGICMEVVGLLLEAGADPALAETRGHIPLHMAARRGHLGLVDMLYSAAPSTLNRRTAQGQTPFFSACAGGHERVASRLLSLGAMERMPLDGTGKCPLVMAVSKGFVGVVQVLINQGGITAVGGKMALANALHIAVISCQARILRMLLTVDGEVGRSKWSNTSVNGVPLLHVGASLCHRAEVRVLLEAGADEVTLDSQGPIPLDIIGRCRGRNGEPQMRRGEEVAVRRMLQRGPAYRSRSWAWPSDEEGVVGGRVDGDAAATAVAAAATSVLVPLPAVNPLPVIGVRIFRPKEQNNCKFFVGLIGR